MCFEFWINNNKQIVEGGERGKHNYEDWLDQNHTQKYNGL